MPAPAAAPKRSWVGLAIFLVMVAIAAAAVGVLVTSEERDDAAPSDSSAPGLSGQEGEGTVPTTSIPPSTTVPRVTQVELLQQYCSTPGVKWPEVPPHVPGEPSRTFVKVSSVGVDTARDTESTDYGQLSPAEMGGSTILSPQTDGQFALPDAKLLASTRTVTCVNLLGTEGVGQTCPYNGPLGDLRPVNLQLAVNKFDVVVYELHSGGILHKGEIHTRAGGCPEWAITSEASGLAAYGLVNQDVLGWLNSHFVDGKPA